MHIKNLLFFGSSEFAIPSLEQLAKSDFGIAAVVTRPDKPVGRKKKPAPTPVKQAAEELGLEVIETEKPTKELLKTYAPDVCVVIAYGKIIPRTLLDVPTHGFVNLHPSLLPRWQGPSPIQTAILEGDSTTGVSVIRLDAGIDTGPVLAQEEVEMKDDDTAETLHDRCAKAGAQLLLAVLPEYLRGKLQPTPQSGNATVSKLLTRDDGKLDWTKDARVLERQIRAFTPWPGAWAMMNGNRMKILDAEVLDVSAQPGEVALMGDGLVVGCGTGALVLKTLQREGKNPMTGDEFLRGFHDVIPCFK